MSTTPLRAMYVNCSLKPDPAASHTQRLMERSASILRSEGVEVQFLHAAARHIPFGMSTDMTNHGAERDDWPSIQEDVDQSDILVVGTPIWLGVKSSIASLVMERLYAGSATTNSKGQYRYYGKVGGCIVTGNEDGVKAVAMDVLYALSHIGFTIPPQADAGWIGEIGPGPSYGDELDDGTRAGFATEFTNKNTTMMAWNLIHTARMLRDSGGVPAVGNTEDGWQEVANASLATEEA